MDVKHLDYYLSNKWQLSLSILFLFQAASSDYLTIVYFHICLSHQTVSNSRALGPTSAHLCILSTWHRENAQIFVKGMKE